MAPNHQGLREQHLRAPGSDNGPTILAALARMEANLATVAADVVGLAAGMTGLAADVDLVKNQVRFHARNGVARTYNSRAYSATCALQPLRNVDTGAAIPGFAVTLAALSALSASAVTEILRAIGADVTGRIEEKRVRLRVCVGLKPM